MFVNQQGRIAWFIPTTLVGGILFLSAVLVLFNPETRNVKLNDHVETNDTESTESEP